MSCTTVLSYSSILTSGSGCEFIAVFVDLFCQAKSATTSTSNDMHTGSMGYTENLQSSNANLVLDIHHRWPRWGCSPSHAEGRHVNYLLSLGGYFSNPKIATTSTQQWYAKAITDTQKTSRVAM